MIYVVTYYAVTRLPDREILLPDPVINHPARVFANQPPLNKQSRRPPTYLLFGVDNLANTRPTMNAWIRQPNTLCVDMTTMASAHSVVVALLP